MVILTDHEEMCQMVVKKDVIDHLLFLVSYQKEPKIVQEALNALLNIVNSRDSKFDRLTTPRGILILMEKIKNTKKVSEMRIAIQILSCICQLRHIKDFQQLNQLFELMCEILKSGILQDLDEKVLITLEALTEYSCFGQGQIEVQVVKKCRLIPFLFEYMVKEKSMRQYPAALAILRNLLMSDDDQMAELVLKAGYLDFIFHLINHPLPRIQKQVLQMISNMADGSEFLKQSLFLKKELMDKLCELVWFSNQHLSIKSEIYWTYGNLADSDFQKYQKQFIQHILSNRLIQGIILLLNSEEDDIVTESLQNLGKILEFGQQTKKGKKNNLLRQRLNEQKHIIHKIDQLNRHPQAEILQVARDIYQNYVDLQRKYELMNNFMKEL